MFMDGIAVDRVVGFEELGERDDFPTLLLTRRLINSGVLRALNKDEKGEMKIRRVRAERDASDSDWETKWRNGSRVWDIST